MVDIFSTPYTQGLHVVERYRLLDYETAKGAQERGQKENRLLPFNDAGMDVDPNYRGSGLQLEFTVADEGVFTMPWSAVLTYRRARGELPEFGYAEKVL